MQARSATGERTIRRPARHAEAASPEVDEALVRLAALPGGTAFVRLLVTRLTLATDEAEREQRVVAELLPPVAAMSDVATTQLLWNARARADALSEFGALTAAEVDQLRGVQTTNPHATVGRWLKEGRLFAVDSPAGRLFPAFQFLGAEPRPEIARVLLALADQLRGWELLTWFSGSSGYLEGARPVQPA